MNFKNYYLDLKELSKLNDDLSNRIHDYYREMLFSKQDGRDDMAISIFNTLWNSGFLKEVRDKKINQILDEDNCINN